MAGRTHRTTSPAHAGQGIEGLRWCMKVTSSMVPGLWMYQNAFDFQRMGYACAIGVILFLIILGLTILNLRYFRSAEQLQGTA